MRPAKHWHAVAPAIAVIALLAGCATTGPTGPEGPGGSGGTSAANCEGVTTGGFELFVDPRLSVSPSVAVAPLTTAAESLEFTDADFEPGTTYGYEYAYVSGGSAFSQGGSFFFETEGSNGFDAGGGTFRITGPLAPSSADGGPYAGILTITATTSTGITTLANVCVMLAEDA